MDRPRPQRELLRVAFDQHGFVTSSDARALDIDPVHLRKMAHRGVLERISQGVYRWVDAPHARLTPYMAACLWPLRVRGVISHASALDLHDLCDANPSRIHVTVPAATGGRDREVPFAYVIHRRDLPPQEVTELDGVPVVTPIRAILDGVGTGVRPDLIRQAIDTLRRRGELGLLDEERAFAALAAARHAAG